MVETIDIQVDLCIEHLTKTPEMPDQNNKDQADGEQQLPLDGNCSFVTSFDGTGILLRSFLPPNYEQSDKMILILHGMAEHSRPYHEVIVKYLSALRVPIFSMDFRGHGLSGRRHGDLESSSAIMRDMNAVISHLRSQYPLRNFFLLGESMGGLFGIAYASSHQEQVQGLILLAPGLSLRPVQLLAGSSLASTAMTLLKPAELSIDLLGERLEVQTRNPEFIRARKEDKLSLQKLSLKYFLIVVRIGILWPVYALKLRIPVLVMQGLKDGAVDPNGAIWFYRILRTRDKSLHLFQELNHTLLWDSDTPRVLKEVTEWLQGH